MFYERCIMFYGVGVLMVFMFVWFFKIGCFVNLLCTFSIDFVFSSFIYTGTYVKSSQKWSLLRKQLTSFSHLLFLQKAEFQMFDLVLNALLNDSYCSSRFLLRNQSWFQNLVNYFREKLQLRSKIGFCIRLLLAFRNFWNTPFKD